MHIWKKWWFFKETSPNILWTKLFCRTLPYIAVFSYHWMRSAPWNYVDIMSCQGMPNLGDQSVTLIWSRPIISSPRSPLTFSPYFTGFISRRYSRFWLEYWIYLKGETRFLFIFSRVRNTSENIKTPVLFVNQI